MTPIHHKVTVSQHALDRFRQRMGVGLSDRQIIDFILSPEVRLWVSWGAEAIYGHRGLNIYARGGTICTLTPDHWPTIKEHFGLSRSRKAKQRRKGRRPEVAAE